MTRRGEQSEQSAVASGRTGALPSRATLRQASERARCIIARETDAMRYRHVQFTSGRKTSLVVFVDDCGAWRDAVGERQRVQHKHAPVPAVGIAPSTFSTSPQIAASRGNAPYIGRLYGAAPCGSQRKGEGRGTADLRGASVDRERTVLRAR